ncbi:hypothetical protein [Bosea robiniae]|uniref:Lipoprotein n=1 Tax=Bosea robiniae TaxID=1036780 RepID=A0ABY0P458_9HYPH|nr:hypothetical protein [Bosea robiniae]SDH21986.1 hypothetical protein SAMN05421844_107194 [Bosea robiniae]
MKMATRIDGTAFPCASPAIRAYHRVLRWILGGLAAAFARPFHSFGMALSFCLLFGIVLGGCTTLSGGQGGNACQIMKAIRPTAEDADTVSVELGRQIVAHNRYVEEVCGARP